MRERKREGETGGIQVREHPQEISYAQENSYVEGRKKDEDANVNTITTNRRIKHERRSAQRQLHTQAQSTNE
jgi:hypothetical protein